MDSGEKTKVKILGIIIGSAVLGAAFAIPVLRAMQGGVETISTVSLLSFFFTAGLSVSAIVLAITAIFFSRTAERTIVKKSEEMSAMQAAMIAQSLAAIGRMESSAGRVGEKIAGTICDNFEMLAQEIQESRPPRDVLRADVTEALAEAGIAVEQQEKNDQPKVKAVIAGKTFRVEPEPVAVIPAPELKISVPVTDEMREKADKKYGEFKDIVLLGVANYPGVIARKIGEGQYRTGGDELVDGVFVIRNEKVAVCTFCTNDIITDRFMGENGDSFNVFLRSLVNELKCGHFTRVFLVFDGKLSHASLYAKALNGLSSRIEAATFACFELFEGSPDIIIPELTERASRLMDAVRESAAADEDVPDISFRRQMMGA
ncbi:MAG: hypothetical protein WC701_07805 [Kiritimatiellales bacterium]|jgi:hypothetical protein